MAKFYDVHMHLFDLSHPNLSAFIFRKDLIDTLIKGMLTKKKVRWGIVALPLLFALILLLPGIYHIIFTILFVVFGIVIYCFLGKLSDLIARAIKTFADKNIFIKNTLSFYEIPIEYQFLLMDYFLKNTENKDDTIVENEELTVDEKKYNKIVLCPHSIDFGYKNINEAGVFYNKAPFKPIAKQLGDLFYAIYTYYRFNLEEPLDNDSHKLVLTDLNPTLDKKERKQKHEEIKATKIFEIYPFMGLNPANYSLNDLRGTAEKEGLLDKYFSQFDGKESAADRQKRLYDKLGKFNGKMYEKKSEIYKDIFAGIKVYPQLGFDPYPEELENEDVEDTPLKKVQFLYQYCIEKRIPIMSHCSDSGFKVDEFDNLTDPGSKWKTVLAAFPELTVCFAHFGSQANEAQTWKDTILNLTKENKNVFTDISCNDCSEKYYNNLDKIIKDNEHAKNKIVFGTDFSINMLASKVNSYNSFLKTFMDSKLENKNNLYTVNSEAYLFGGCLP
jgi:hypothetical protein